MWKPIKQPWIKAIYTVGPSAEPELPLKMQISIHSETANLTAIRLNHKQVLWGTSDRSGSNNDLHA
jgi:hypothetical protein